MNEQPTDAVEEPPVGSEENFGQEPFPDRRAKANRYFDVHLNKQREWYSKNASKAKNWSNRLALVVLGAGALISVIQIFHDKSYTPLITAILGAVVVLAKGLERIGKYNETWMGYRKASETMKREYRLYINNAGDYPDATDEKDAYRWFVEQVERILAEEQNQFWQSRSKAPEPANAPKKPTDDEQKKDDK